jgi:hypothetical protein
MVNRALSLKARFHGAADGGKVRLLDNHLHKGMGYGRKKESVVY